VDDDVKPDSRNSDGRTPLSLTAELGHEAVVKLLLTTPGVNATSADSKDCTSPWWAAQSGNEVVTQALLAKMEKACLDTPDSDDETPLLCAARNEHKAWCGYSLLPRG
jgi:ankyrin repeat protein